MSDISNDDIFEQLGRLISLGLQGTGCDDMHFAFVVWCKCEDTPLYAVTNDGDNHRVRFMLNDAGEKLMVVVPSYMEGHA